MSLWSRLVGAKRPPVSAVVHVSPFDAPYLATTLPHVLRQLRFEVAERIVVIDDEAVRGAGEKADRAALDRVLVRAVADRVIDRVVELDPDRRAIRARYFGPASPAAADADDAVYSTLFALEAARHDVVAWIDADVLFHATGEGWVAAGVDALDEHVWFAATRGGPSWLPRNANVSAGGHFVCDRRRLHGKLRWVSKVFFDAMQRYGATAKIVDGGWHLRTRSHARPYAQWIDRLAPAVERGDVPECQRDGWLHLADLRQRSEWRQKLFTPSELSLAARASGPVARVLEKRPVAGSQPVSVIVPIRNRAGADVENALRSLAWQHGGAPFETILVSHGSEPRIEAELRALAVRTGATLYAVGTPSEPWNKPLALNTGICATDPSVPFVMTMDADMILADNLLETVVAELSADPQQVILCRSSDLPEDCALPADIRAAFGALKATADLRGEYGTGGIQAMPRQFVVDIRGYDEDMRWWGALDTDLVRRAETAGLRATWVTERTAMLHQWHPRKHRILADDVADDAREAWLRNHELMYERGNTVVRNHGGWGATFERGGR